jgi:hypothetical protein
MKIKGQGNENNLSPFPALSLWEAFLFRNSLTVKVVLQFLLWKFLKKSSVKMDTKLQVVSIATRLTRSEWLRSVCDESRLLGELGQLVLSFIFWDWTSFTLIDFKNLQILSCVAGPAWARSNSLFVATRENLLHIQRVASDQFSGNALESSKNSISEAVERKPLGQISDLAMCPKYGVLYINDEVQGFHLYPNGFGHWRGVVSMGRERFVYGPPPNFVLLQALSLVNGVSTDSTSNVWVRGPTCLRIFSPQEKADDTFFMKVENAKIGGRMNQ